MEAGTTSPAIADRAMNPPERDSDRVAAPPPRVIPVRYAVDVPTVFPRRGTTPISTWLYCWATRYDTGMSPAGHVSWERHSRGGSGAKR